MDKFSDVLSKFAGGLLIVLEFLVFGALGSLLSKTHQLLLNINWLAFLGVVFFTVKQLNLKSNQLSLKSAGFTFRRGWQKLLTGFALAVGIFSVCLVVCWLTKYAQINFISHIDVKKLTNASFSCLGIGIWEELLFRGFILITLLRSKVNTTLAILISSILFGLIHSPVINSSANSAYWPIGAFAISCILSILYLHTGSIIAPIVFHWVWDILASIIDTGDKGVLAVINMKAIPWQYENVIAVVLLVFVPITWYVFRKRRLPAFEDNPAELIQSMKAEAGSMS